MFGRKSSQTSSNRPSSNSKKTLSQYGLMDVGDFDGTDDNFDDDGDDDDLEAELLALTSDGGHKKPTAKKPGPVVNPNDLSRMIQDSLRDIPSDEDVSSGEDDPSILAELEELGGGSTEIPEGPTHNMTQTSNPIRNVLTERLKMYELAEENAKKANESTKLRRMSRGIGTLKDLIKKADAGHPISEDAIPPPVSVAAPKQDIPAAVSSPEPVPSSDGRENTPASPPPIPPRAVKRSSSESKDSPVEQEAKIKPSGDDVATPDSTSPYIAEMLEHRQKQYKVAAVAAKRNGDIPSALAYTRIVKQFEIVINEVTKGASIDLSTIPPPLDDSSPQQDVNISAISPPEQPRQESIKLTSSSADENQSTVTADAPSGPGNRFSPPEPYVAPKTILEALEQRLKKFQESEEAAKKENNDSKGRRMGRIVKQYKDAIKLHKAGKPIPVDELPTPPGFAPIPVPGGSATEPSQPATTPQPAPEKKPAPTRIAPTPPKNDSVASPPTLQMTRNDKQLQAVLERQKAYKLAASKALKEGDKDAARGYLKIAKGMDPMIEAAKSGLPIDLKSLPLPPEEKKSLDSEYEIVRLNDCVEGTTMDVFNKLSVDLQQQLEMCIRTRDHYKAVGDVANANRVDQLALQTKKDLKFVQLAESSNLKVPKFHYETKPFTIVQCNTDLTDNEVEVIVVQGINYNVPNPQQVDTYVKLFFPYPTDAPQQYKTSVVYDTNNPKYDASVKFSIQRNVRACQRIFKRQTLKCEVWSKGGFFRSDSLIGTVNAKLLPLETQCSIHDAFDLMDGRKTVGGKLELKIKARDPIMKKEVVHVEEKWLIIDT
ncbi:hypothetical protein V9T40_014692 [Parthenolecanium corni]|uniref:C2 domain-containing protein n=1 Tax=Parthenolecanium corni TaxID=536013 RepID=A0AAN9T353_9HEMI